MDEGIDDMKGKGKSFKEKLPLDNIYLYCF